MSDTDISRYWYCKYEESYKEVASLLKDLKEAEDVIAYALEMTSEDDAIAVFKDFLGVEE